MQQTHCGLKPQTDIGTTNRQPRPVSLYLLDLFLIDRFRCTRTPRSANELSSAGVDTSQESAAGRDAYYRADHRFGFSHTL